MVQRCVYATWPRSSGAVFKSRPSPLSCSPAGGSQLFAALDGFEGSPGSGPFPPRDVRLTYIFICPCLYECECVFMCVCVFVSGLLQLHKSSILAFCFDYSRMGVMITTYLIHLCTFIFIALISSFFSSFLLSIYCYFRILLLFSLPSFLISFAYTIFGNFNCTFIQMLKQLPYFLNSLLYSNLLPF